MTESKFSRACKSAIAERDSARRDAVEILVRRFAEGITDMDPRVLRRLGPQELKDFLAKVREGGIALAQPSMPEPPMSPTPTPAPPPKRMKTSDWASCRRSEPLWALWAVVEGTIWGSLAIVIGTAFLMI